MSQQVARFGTWISPLSAQAVAAAGLRLSAVAVDGDDIYWLEGRPQEGGRYVVVRRSPDGSIADVVPAGVNVRTRVHEYGGGAYAVAGGVLYFSDFRDHRLYRIDIGSAADVGALTPPGDYSYADLIVDQSRRRLICVREDRSKPGEPENTLVSIPLDGAPHAGEVLASGYDFYSTPRLSPDSSTLAWLCWRHPRMPWEGTELWVADVTPSGTVTQPRRIAGGDEESIYQPGWSPDGTLYYASDRTGYWQLYRSAKRNAPNDPNGPNDPNDPNVLNDPNAPNAPNDPNVLEAEFGLPQWTFGTSTWACAGSRLVVTYTRRGRWHLATVDEHTGAVRNIAPDIHPHEWLTATATHAVLVAGWTTAPDAVVRVALDTGEVELLCVAAVPALQEADVSVAQPIQFPTGQDLVAYAFYYPPRNARFAPLPGESPPLIVITHGGPTAAASCTFNLNIQYWTTRGFAVVDVDYRGSTGYGREYRERLNGAWGIADVEDVISAAKYLCELRLGETRPTSDSSDARAADSNRLIIRGGSAGGYTTLAALAFHPEVFGAGASYYGISDLEALEVDTHKFESRYSHSLIGPYPAAKDLYRERSPIHFIDRLSCSLILFQGLEDKVVPANQSQMMADAVRTKGLPVAYLAFEGEQHGFRKADTIVRCLEAELYFYGKVFGFTPAGALEPVTIDNIRDA